MSLPSWVARWVKDDDGAIGISFLGGFITLIKYKHSVLVFWFHQYASAGKWQGEEIEE